MGRWQREALAALAAPPPSCGWSPSPSQVDGEDWFTAAIGRFRSLPPGRQRKSDWGQEGDSQLSGGNLADLSPNLAPEESAGHRQASAPSGALTAPKPSAREAGSQDRQSRPLPRRALKGACPLWRKRSIRTRGRRMSRTGYPHLSVARTVWHRRQCGAVPQGSRRAPRMATRSDADMQCSDMPRRPSMGREAQPTTARTDIQPS